MIIKILKYDPVSGRGTYSKADGTQVKFRYTAFKKEAVWSGNLGRLENEKITKAKWYDIFNWTLRRVIKWQS